MPRNLEVSPDPFLSLIAYLQVYRFLFWNAWSLFPSCPAAPTPVAHLHHPHRLPVLPQKPWLHADCPSSPSCFHSAVRVLWWQDARSVSGDTCHQALLPCPSTCLGLLSPSLMGPQQPGPAPPPRPAPSFLCLGTSHGYCSSAPMASRGSVLTECHFYLETFLSLPV